MEDGNSKGNLPLGLNLPMINSKMTLSFEEKSAIKAFENLLMFGKEKKNQLHFEAHLLFEYK